MAQRHQHFALAFHLLEHASPAFAKHAEQAPQWWHHVVYAAADLLADDLISRPADLAAALIHEPFRVLAKFIFGEVHEGLPGAFRRLPLFPLWPGAYEKLHLLLAKPTKRKMIAHAKAIDSNLIDALFALPVEAVSPKVLELCLRELPAETVAHRVHSLKKVLPPERQMAAWRRLRQVNEGRTLKAWFRECLLDVPFPEPPWLGNDMIRPVRTGRELVSVSKIYRNCLASWLPVHIEGLECTYVWLGSYGGAVAALRYSRITGWTLSEIGAYQNGSLMNEVRKFLISQFAAQGFPFLEGHALFDL
jgi:hypothetical protein